MNTEDVTTNLLMVRHGIEEILERGQRMSALASAIAATLEGNDDTIAVELTGILYDMLSDLKCQYDIQARVEAAIAEIAPAYKIEKAA